MTFIKSFVLCLLLVAFPPAFAKGSHKSGGHGSSHASHSSSHASSGSHASSSGHAGTKKAHSASRASSRSNRTSSRSSTRSSSHSRSKTASGVKRDSHGKIARSQKAKDEFRKSHPCPSTGKTTGACKGYVIDHVQALKHGGADTSSNMAWQTKEAAKAKDKWE